MEHAHTADAVRRWPGEGLLSAPRRGSRIVVAGPIVPDSSARAYHGKDVPLVTNHL